MITGQTYKQDGKGTWEKRWKKIKVWENGGERAYFNLKDREEI
jgi:hypothetical protein